MLFMSVYTYGPKERDAVIKRRAEKGPILPPGLKIVGEWSYLGGGRVFRLIEGDDPRAMLGATSSWADLGKIEIFPVMETEEAVKLFLSNHS
jgi:hypothetical protein